MIVEREHDLAAIRTLLASAIGGAGTLLFVAGEAGVGKTTLLRTVADAAPPGVLVRRGGCDNLATPAALGPVLDAAPELAAAPDDDSRITGYHLFRQVRDILAGRPALLLLEDVHWADEATLDLLRYFGRRIGTLPLLVMATFRADEVTATHPLTTVLGDLATQPAVARMEVRPLTVDGVRRLLNGDHAAIDPVALHRRTEGNPFYVTEVLGAGVETVPPTVRDAVLARTSRLSAAARDALAAIAVLGHRVEADLVAALCPESATAVDECLNSGVVVADGDRLGFRHELARAAIEHATARSRRLDLHARALAELRARGSLDDRRLAYHAAGCADRYAVAVHAPRAARRAVRFGAHREAAEQYRLALAWIDDSSPDRPELLERLSYECHLTDQFAEAFDLRLQALELHRLAGTARRVGDTLRWLSRLSYILGCHGDCERYANAAIATLEPLGEGPELAMAYSNLAQIRMLEDDCDSALHWGHRAIDLARRGGDREVEMHALNNVGTALCVRGDIAEGSALLAKSLDLAQADDAQEHVARAFTNLATTAVAGRRFGTADPHLRAGIAHCADRDLDLWWLYLTAWLARSLADQGHYEAAETQAAAVLRHPQVAPISAIHALVVASQIAIRRGGDGREQLDRAWQLAARTTESQRMVPVALARAEAAWLAGDTDRIVTEIDHVWATELEHPQPWELGELLWWLKVAGVRRQVTVAIPSPFQLMLSGQYAEAAKEWQSLGCPLWVALSLAAAEDVSGARTSIAILDSLGATVVKTAVLRERHQRGLPVPRGPRPASQANPAGLTTREIEVLRLLAEGLSTSQVAAKLFLSSKTVGHHVSATLRKLGEPTRASAVATALRRGIVHPT